MILLDLLLKPVDFIAAPICFVLLWMIFSFIARKYKDETQRRLYYKAFYYKMLFALLFTLMCSFYYRSGDTIMYYDATGFLHNAVMDDPKNLVSILTTQKLSYESSFLNYFLYGSSIYPVFEAMKDPGNFMAPKLALIPSLIFNKSYFCICMCFSFFALGGAIRLYKFFVYYYPKYYREIALATLFLPSVTLWSSGLMKDPICFGSVGYLVYGIQNIFIKREKIFTSFIWVIVSIFLLFYTKIYILLAIAPAVLVWLFREVNKVVKNKTLRNIMGVFTLAIGIFLAFRLVNYVTSDESLRAFRLDNISEFSEHNRNLYESFSQKEEGSYFSIKTSNPALLIFNGIVATLYRPFLWEINGVTALLSALEALFFLYLTVYFLVKKGVKKFFKYIFSQPILFLCLIFSLVFAAAVGSTALNFGSLSRYKIPCLPFYLVMMFVLFQEFKIQFPGWLKKLLGYKTLPAWMEKTKPQFS